MLKAFELIHQKSELFLNRTRASYLCKSQIKQYLNILDMIKAFDMPLQKMNPKLSFSQPDASVSDPKPVPKLWP